MYNYTCTLNTVPKPHPQSSEGVELVAGKFGALVLENRIRRSSTILGTMIFMAVFAGPWQHTFATILRDLDPFFGCRMGQEKADCLLVAAGSVLVWV